VLRKIGLERVIDRVPNRERDLVVDIFVARIIETATDLSHWIDIASRLKEKGTQV
jgi:hypothetical protein